MRQKTYNDADGSRIDSLQGADINALGVVSEPVTEVDARDHHSGPFLAVDEGQSLEHVFDVAMSPVVALDLGDGGNIASTESFGFAWEDNQDKSQDQQDAAPAYPETRHSVLLNMAALSVVVVCARAKE